VTLSTADVVAVGGLHDVGRNLLHNSLFNVAQRGTGQFTATAAYTADRWRQDLSLDVVTTQPTAVSDAFRAGIGDEAATTALSSNVAGNAGATAFTLISQPIEGVRRLSGKTITVSLWAWATAGTPKVGIGLRQSFGTGGSPSALVDVNATPITLTTSPARYSVTLAVPSASGKTLGTNGDDFTRLGLYLSAGANSNTIAGGIGVQSGTFVVWGVQLEIGSTATPLEKPDPADDLRRCQRFYQASQLIVGGYSSVAGAVVYHSSNFQTLMRGQATVTPVSPTLGNCGSLSMGAYSGNAVFFSTTITAIGSWSASVPYTASADL
jgi:hypothetical protein